MSNLTTSVFVSADDLEKSRSNILLSGSVVLEFAGVTFFFENAEAVETFFVTTRKAFANRK